MKNKFISLDLKQFVPISFSFYVKNSIFLILDYFENPKKEKETLPLVCSVFD